MWPSSFYSVLVLLGYGYGYGHNNYARSRSGTYDTTRWEHWWDNLPRILSFPKTFSTKTNSKIAKRVKTFRKYLDFGYLLIVLDIGGTKKIHYLLQTNILLHWECDVKNQWRCQPGGEPQNLLLWTGCLLWQSCPHCLQWHGKKWRIHSGLRFIFLKFIIVHTPYFRLRRVVD